jgi:Polysaccharide biosynthesis protein
LKNELVRNALGLSGVQVTSMLVPLVTIPYLTRFPGPSSWGLLAFAQTFDELMQIRTQVPVKIVGMNPRIPGGRPSRNWEELRSFYCQYRTY